MRRRAAPSRAQRGMSLLEIVMAVAILAILAATMIPSFDTMRARAVLRGVAENLQLDLQYARSEALQRNSPVSVVFTSGTAWCYGINQGSGTCDCAAATCSIKNVGAASYKGVTMSGVSFAASGASTGRYVIGPRRGETLDSTGASTGGNVTFSAGSLQAIVDVNAVGRIHACSPSGGVAGFPSC